MTPTLVVVTNPRIDVIGFVLCVKYHSQTNLLVPGSQTEVGRRLGGSTAVEKRVLIAFG